MRQERFRSQKRISGFGSNAFQLFEDDLVLRLRVQGKVLPGSIEHKGKECLNSA
jgi:hypothetical protein